MHHWTGSALVQVMACRLFGTKPSPEQMLSIGLLGTNFSETQIRILSFSFKKMHLKLSSVKMAAILSKGRWVKHHNLVRINLTVAGFYKLHYSLLPTSVIHPGITYLTNRSTKIMKTLSKLVVFKWITIFAVTILLQHTNSCHTT